MAIRRSVLRAWLATSLAVLAAPGAAAGDESGRTNGGAQAPVRPDVRSVACIATPAMPCPASGALVRGGRLTVKGDELDSAARIVFLGRRGKRDDVSVTPDKVDHDRVEAPVEPGAKSGRVMVVNRGGKRAASAKRVRVTGSAAPTAGSESSGSNFFYDGTRKPAFSFQVDQAGTVTVELVRDSDGSVVQRWEVAATPGQPSTVEWDPGAATVPNGRYRFRLAGGVSGARADGRDSFTLYDHIFPIRGRHNMGYTDTNNFGGGRDHKGQDMFAACGTRLVAARGGTVEYSGFHSAAGNYVVIDGTGTDVDYVYMHMRDPAPVKTGDRVRTGQDIGRVGETGRASGCHLHFELWSGPGWYTGGEAFDPLPQLRAWDAYS